MPNDAQSRNGKASFLAGHISRARFFDLDAISDKSSPYPHMLPSPETFAAAMSKLGIHRDDAVVVYDGSEQGIFSAPRVAWTLKVFGHADVHILNNFKLWVDQGFPVEKGEPEETYQVTDYAVPQLDKSRVIAFEELKESIQEQGKEGAEEITIVDARGQGRFDGTADEPRPGTIYCLLMFFRVLLCLLCTNNRRSLFWPHAQSNQHSIHRCPERSNKSLPSSR
jgi:thiosulfate/3-mercaptopyruvate sulfurtransferase